MIKTRKLKSPLVKPEPAKPTPALASPVTVAPVQPSPAKIVQVAPVKTQPVQVATAKGARVSLELLKPDAKKVCVAGSFNGWKPEQTPLMPLGNGRWVGDLAVNPGKYEYLFVVDGQWVPDPNAKESVQNPFGGKNSVLTVSE
jgi:1,4-alpha-glucan branching enzyme